LAGRNAVVVVLLLGGTQVRSKPLPKQQADFVASIFDQPTLIEAVDRE